MAGKQLADIKNPSIEALLNGLYKFTAEEKAKVKLELLRKNFVISKQNEQDSTLKLWVRGYEISASEYKKGYEGNFAEIYIAKISGKKFTLKIKKLVVDLKSHPAKKRPPQIHPSWEHKILRSISSKNKYNSLDAANAVLEKLADEFPEATTPAVNKIYVLIYEKSENKKSPIKKYTFESKETSDGKFSIHVSLDQKPLDKTKKQDLRKPIKQQENVQGHFTKLVVERRKRKKKK